MATTAQAQSSSRRVAGDVRRKGVVHQLGLSVIRRIQGEELPADLRRRLVVAVVEWATARGL